MGALQPAHLIIVLVIVLLLFGPGKLPQLGKAVGDAVRELKKATTEGEGHQASTTTATTALPIATRSLTCPSCHAIIGASEKFCGSCGTSLTDGLRVAAGNSVSSN